MLLVANREKTPWHTGNQQTTAHRLPGLASTCCAEGPSLDGLNVP